MAEESDTSDSEVSKILESEDWESIPDQLKPKIEAFILAGKYESFHSPLLPPELLERYDLAIPGLSAKLVEWTEEETAHRRTLESRSFDEARALRFRGQLFGVVVACAGLISSGVVGAFAAAYNSPAAAITAPITAIVSVGGPFAARLLAKSWRDRPSERTAD